MFSTKRHSEKGKKGGEKRLFNEYHTSFGGLLQRMDWQPDDNCPNYFNKMDKIVYNLVYNRKRASMGRVQHWYKLRLI